MQPTRLKRAIQPMPEDIRALPETEGLAARYAQRPAYQRNDYLGWIARAKLPQTRKKRVEQMLRELREGGVYMGMAWHSTPEG